MFTIKNLFDTFIDYKINIQSQIICFVFRHITSHKLDDIQGQRNANSLGHISMPLLFLSSAIVVYQ